MTRTMYIAAVFLATLASAQANQCTSGGGGGCTGDNAPQNIVSMLQTKLQANILEDGAKEDLLVNADAPQGHQGSGIIASKKPGQLASGFAKSNPDAVLTELQQNVRDGTTPPVEVISQIKSLITDDIMPGLQAARDIVAKETAKVMADIDTCNNDFTSSEAYPGSALQESVNTTRQNHSTCRHLEQEMYFDNLTHDSACVELGELLHRTFPSSIPSSHLHTSWRDAAVQYASDTLHAILELDGNCTNQESKLERKTKECASGQMRFESDFCYWKSSLESSCNELERCYSRTLSLYNEHVADLQVLHKKWDYESATLQKILCFCNVWLEETDGGDNRSQYNASHFTVCSDVTHTPSPLVIEPPPKANCLLSSVASHPGTVDFFTQEYTNFSNFVEAVVPCRDEPTTVAPTSSTQAPTTEAPTTEAPTTEALPVPSGINYRIYTTRMSSPSRYGFWCVGEVRFYDVGGAEISTPGVTTSASAGTLGGHETSKTIDGTCASGFHFCSLKAPSISEPAWLMFTFPAPTTVSRVRLENDPNAFDQVDPYDIKIEVSNDGVSWSTVATVSELPNHGQCATNDITLAQAR